MHWIDQTRLFFWDQNKQTPITITKEKERKEETKKSCNERICWNLNRFAKFKQRQQSKCYLHTPFSNLWKKKNTPSPISHGHGFVSREEKKKSNEFSLFESCRWIWKERATLITCTVTGSNTVPQNSELWFVPSTNSSDMCSKHDENIPVR